MSYVKEKEDGRKEIQLRKSDMKLISQATRESLEEEICLEVLLKRDRIICMSGGSEFQR